MVILAVVIKVYLSKNTVKKVLFYMVFGKYLKFFSDDILLE